MTCSLEKLSVEFQKAIHNHHYLGSTANPPHVLESKKQKTMQLAEVFKLALNQIESNLKTREKGLTHKEIFYLKALQEQGDTLYQRYNTSTKSWVRTLVKCLAYCMPEFIKRLLPCLSIEKEERETYRAFANYNTFLARQIKQENEEIFDPDIDDFFYPDEYNIQHLLFEQHSTSITAEKTVSSQSPFLSFSEKSKKEAMVEQLASLLENSLNKLRQFNEHPYSLNHLKHILLDLHHSFSILSEIERGEQKLLEKFHFSDQERIILNNPDFGLALIADKHEAIMDILAPTPWQNDFKRAITQCGKSIIISMRKLADQNMLILMNENGLQLKEKELIEYRGQIKIKITNSSDLGVLKELKLFLENHLSCSPSTLIINLKEHTLTSTLVKWLLELKERITQIEIEGLQEINFKTLALTQEEENDFLKNLHTFFPFLRVERIILPDHSKERWTAYHFSATLNISPSLDLLKQCYADASSYQDISLPISLQNIKAFDARGFTLDQISHLLAHFPKLTFIDFGDSPLTDAQLTHLLQKFLKGIRHLELKGCQQLTTDILFTLADLPHLSSLSLPDLPVGNASLTKLPKFDNPFKIQQLYTASKATQTIVTELYIGPHAWSALFQIPLARLGVKHLFPSHQKRIDPKSVAYWLYQDDYRFLAPQESIVTILADSNAKLCDDNVVEFMQKFPKATSLSLYQCPNVTDRGIIRLLQAHSQLEALDLTECDQVTERLLDDPYIPYLKKLKKIIVSGTRISSEAVARFQKQGIKLIFENMRLKITDDDLIDDQALEKLLNSHPLNQLTYIDLQGCTTLTNDMLGGLLERFNAHAKITSVEGTLVDNPERLNAATINIQGCNQITDKAFHLKKDPDACPKTITLKLLGNLNRVIIGKTKIPKLIPQLYSQIIFQEVEEPLTIQIDPKLQLEKCLAYQQKKNQFHLENKENLKVLGKSYLHDRIVVELFHHDYENIKRCFQEPVDIHSEDFSDITLYFMTSDSHDPTIFYTHRDVLSSQSLYFLKGFRPGGEMSKNHALDIDNVHVNLKSAQAIMQLFYGSLSIGDLDWKTAADVAEIIGPQNFKFPTFYYKQLLTHIHARFDVENGDELLTIAKELGDEEGKKIYEKTLLYFLKNIDPWDPHFQDISNLAKGHGLKALLNEVERLEDFKNQKLIQEIEEQEEA